MSAKKVGRVTHFFDHIGVAVLALSDSIRVGDTLHFAGHRTDFVQKVTSMEIEHAPVESAGPRDDVALKVDQPVRPDDAVFRIEGE